MYRNKKNTFIQVILEQFFFLLFFVHKKLQKAPKSTIESACGDGGGGGGPGAGHLHKTVISYISSKYRCVKRSRASAAEPISNLLLQKIKTKQNKKPIISRPVWSPASANSYILRRRSVRLELFFTRWVGLIHPCGITAYFLFASFNGDEWNELVIHWNNIKSETGAISAGGGGAGRRFTVIQKKPTKKKKRNGRGQKQTNKKKKDGKGGGATKLCTRLINK